jgi:rhamnose utilization protein RhaD (predicted bifunctional aldolase and dehydrogenase)
MYGEVGVLFTNRWTFKDYSLSGLNCFTRLLTIIHLAVDWIQRNTGKVYKDKGNRREQKESLWIKAHLRQMRIYGRDWMI